MSTVSFIYIRHMVYLIFENWFVGVDKEKKYFYKSIYYILGSMT